MKYKIGDILKVKRGCEDECGLFEAENGQFIKITDMDNVDYDYDILDKDFKEIGKCSCFKDRDLEPLEKTWETLQEGDVVIHKFDEREILGVSGKIYHLSDCENKEYAGIDMTIQEMKDEGYTIKDAKPEVCKACGNEIKK